MALRLILVMALVVVGGCSLMMPSHQVSPRTPAQTTPPPPPPKVAPPLPPPILPALPPVLKPTLPPKPSITPRSHGLAYLIGMDLAAVEARLGPPSSRREEPPARIWHYADGDCVVKIMFYPDLKDLKYRALTFETNQKDRGQNAVQQCLTRIERKYDRAR